MFKNRRVDSGVIVKYLHLDDTVTDSVVIMGVCYLNRAKVATYISDSTMCCPVVCATVQWS